jgi:hypothetical protein
MTGRKNEIVDEAFVGFCSGCGNEIRIRTTTFLGFPSTRHSYKTCAKCDKLLCWSCAKKNGKTLAKNYYCSDCASLV